MSMVHNTLQTGVLDGIRTRDMKEKYLVKGIESAYSVFRRHKHLMTDRST
jgi:hypothetical protein